MRVSIIVPAYNYARFLPHALDSVLAQTFGDWECIIVDDGSTDDTAAVVAKYADRDARFRYVRQENRGPAAARNHGMTLAAGDYLQFLDADDRLEPHKLALHVRYLDEHPECDIVYGEVSFFRTSDPSRVFPSLGGKLSRSIMGRVHGNAEALRALEHYNIMSTLAAMLRCNVIDKAGLFDESAAGCEDWGYWIRCAIAGCGFDYLASPPVASVRAHETSTSRDRERMLRGLMSVAHAFDASRADWTRQRLPLIYEVALGIEMVEQRARLAGARRIWRAASAASERLTAIRWRIYAVAALVMPRRLFIRFAGTPVPERPFELYRRMRLSKSS